MSVDVVAGGWVVIHCAAFHVVPVNDLREHEQYDCWCNPEIDDGVITHNAMDQRELYEEGKLRFQ